ncbi:hypothetical protein K501DRAFT_337441 [Backusella circina FSU 941]|nr:hypothetical protein K501DRAFT_337441 [Backusella circina FSU 941]
MDSSYSYPHLFDIDDTFNAEMFHGLALQDHHHHNSNTTTNNNTNRNSQQEKKQLQCQQQQQQQHHIQQQHIQHQLHQHQYQQVASTNDDIYSSLASSNSYLQYLQTSPLHNSLDMFYDANAAYGQINLDYDYMHMDQKQQQQYNWLYDSIDTYLPNHTTAPPSFFCQDSISSSLGTPNPMDCMMTDSTEEIKIEGGMSRDYVSLNDVNSFVAKADSIKQSCLELSLQTKDQFTSNGNISNLFSMQLPSQRDHLSFSSSDSNEESDEDYSDNDLQWPSMAPSYSTPVGLNNNDHRLMIKIKKPTCSSSSSSSTSCQFNNDYNNNDYLQQPVEPKSSKSTGYKNNTKYRKSMSNIYLSGKKQPKPKFDKRRGSAPNRLSNNMHSSSSLSSLSSNLQNSMRVSDSICHFLARQSLSDAEEDEDDEDDEDYQVKHLPATTATTKKGRNVDKACNHCKRSHLRCDDMRPCRRCVATGKTGCKDVQHKPRGRPKLHKK